MSRVLIVDDEVYMRKILATNLKQDGHVIAEAGGVLEAKQAISCGEYDVVITDHKMQDGNGIDVLNAVQNDDSTSSVIFLTAVGSIELAVQSMRSGAFDFLVKPFDPEVVRVTVARAAERTNLLRENWRLKTAVGRLERTSDLVGTSPEMARVRDDIGKVAATNATVLITGETGTGKEVVAKAIHKSSERMKAAFMAINCAALPETLLESELFGHERGAFTGADRAHEGLFEAAHQGTLFLDEVAELSPSAQAKLLRVLTDRCVLRLGSTRLRQVDVRLIAATHRDLRQRIREGSFREDLYYRLAVYPIAIPPLRDRKEDIPALSEHLLRLIELELKLPRRQLSAEAMRRLQAYDFPGNVRELRNLIERACIVSEGEEIGPESLPAGLPSARVQGSSPDPYVEQIVSKLPATLNLRHFLACLENQILRRALADTGAQAEAARRLGLSRSDLGYKCTKYQIKTSCE